MGMASAAAATQNKLRITREWKADRRAMKDGKFLASAQMSRDKYNEFTKLSRAFVRAYPNEFKNFLMAHSRGAVARQSFGQPRHMPPVVVPATIAPTFASIELPDFKSVSPSRRIPSAQELEGRRLQTALSGGSNESGGPKAPAVDWLAMIGPRLD